MINRPAGYLLFREDERTTETCLLIKGHVKVTSGDPDRIVAIRGPGEFVGEMSAVDGLPRSADVWAVEDIQIKVILQDEWLGFLYSRPRVFHALTRALSLRLREPRPSSRSRAGSGSSSDSRKACSNSAIRDLDRVRKISDGSATALEGTE